MGKGDKRKHKKKKNKKTKNIPEKRYEKRLQIQELAQKMNISEKKNKVTKMNQSYEIVKENNIKKDNHIAFLNWNYIDTTKLNNFKTLIKDNKTYSIDKTRMEKIAGILDENKLAEKVKPLMPFSFILFAKIKLQSPYFSKDDDEFYLIQNPCLKDKAFKVPMVRGSGWKGAIAKAGKDLINEELKKEELEKGKNNCNNNEIINYIQSYIRIFGTGSDEYRQLIDNLEKENKISGVLIKYLLFELGMMLPKEIIEYIKEKPKECLQGIHENWAKKETKEIPYLNIHKGRAIFYPTFFNRFSLEIINPHDRKKRAGTTPIHYEVVPKESEGILQIVYIPHDGILTKKEILKEEVEKDIEFLTKCIEKTAENGIGAKTKLGWGRFELKNAFCNINENIENLSLEKWDIVRLKDE